MRKLCIKQGCRDLYIINYSFQGLARKICKTQKIVLANIEKFRAGSEKIYGGVGLRRHNRSRGFSANFARHRNLRDNYRILQGLNCKKLKSGSKTAGTVLQIAIVLGYERLQRAGQMKEDDEGIPLHT
jgi:hypothetical protein